MAGGDGRLCGRDAKYSSRREKKASLSSGERFVNMLSGMGGMET